jgi:hypothetical protein
MGSVKLKLVFVHYELDNMRVVSCPFACFVFKTTKWILIKFGTEGCRTSKVVRRIIFWLGLAHYKSHFKLTQKLSRIQPSGM